MSATLLLRLACAAVACAAAACDDGVGEPHAVPAFTVVGADSVREGGAVRFEVRWAGMAPSGATVAWAVAPASLGVVDAGGTLRSASAGQGVVTAIVRVGDASAVRAIPVHVLPADCATQVVIVPDRASLAVGGRFRFGAYTPAPRGVLCDGRDSSNVGFRSLDTLIVGVDSAGWLTGRRSGVARVVAYPRARPAILDTGIVTVLASGPPITMIVATPAFVALAPGDTQQLSVTVNVNPGLPPGTSRAATFASRDTTVASVSAAGLVRAIRAGTTSVIVQAVLDSSVFVAVPVAVRLP